MGFGPACCLRVACQQDLIFKIHSQTRSRLPDLFANISGPLGAEQLLSPGVEAAQPGSKNHLLGFQFADRQRRCPLKQLKEMEGKKSWEVLNSLPSLFASGDLIM